MVRTVIAFESDATRNLVADVLEKEGISVRYRCHTASDVIRVINIMGGGVVICGYKLPDRTAEQLSYDLKDLATCLVVAKPQHLKLCDNENVFKLPLPLNPSVLIGSVNMLLQLDQMRFNLATPSRSDSDTEIINTAKTLLMKHKAMTEPEAHKYIQRRSMENSVKMTETAQKIIASYE